MSPSPSPTRSPSPAALAMAQTMGFSTFGSHPHPPRKKQKVNSTSGSNKSPLGVRSHRKGTGNETAVEKRGGKGVGSTSVDVGRVGNIGQEGEGEDEDATLKGESIHSRDTQSPSNPPPISHVSIPPPHLPHRPPNPTFLPTPTPNSSLPPSHPTPGKHPDGTWDWQALRRGVRDENGDTAFYDASFVEDAWRGLR